MSKIQSRRTFLKRVAAATAVTGFPFILKSRHAFGADTVPVGSLLDKTGPINIYGNPGVAGT